MAWLKQIDDMAFPLPSNSLALDVILVITVLLRAVVLGLALRNLWWSFPSARALLKGTFDPVTIVVATIFWASATAVTFQTAYFVGVGPMWRLAATIVLAISMALAALSHKISIISHSKKLGIIYDNIEVVLPIAELAKVDPAAALRISEECRRLTAGAILSQRA